MTNNTATVTGLETISDVTVATPLTCDDLMVLAAHVKASAEATIATTRASLAEQSVSDRTMVEMVLTRIADSADAMLAKLHAAYEDGLDALWTARLAADPKMARIGRPRRLAPLTVAR